MKIDFIPKHIVILTGAGISAESGIKTFRDANGLWENHDIMEVASPAGFSRNPELVNKFYNQRRSQLLSQEVNPNQAHLSIAKLEREFKNKVTLITQNVDNLHEQAGSKDVIHMHGELIKMRCINSQKVLTIKKDIKTSDKCPCCLIAGNLRPHIVWFGEYPLHMHRIEKELSTCDLFISIGTSGQVYPAAMFVEIAKSHGAYAVEINLEQTNISNNFDEHYIGKASVVVDEIVQKLLRA